MIDIEKVRKGLECCSNTGKGRCESSECPYWIDSICCIDEMQSDALSLLKEQETIKPYIDIDEAKCPICKVKLTRQELLGEDVLFEDFFDYCPRCGRKVKWQ